MLDGLPSRLEGFHSRQSVPSLTSGIYSISDVSGDLLLRGPFVFNRYWNKKEKTVETFTECGWFITGDEAQVSENGVYKIRGLWRGRSFLESSSRAPLRFYGNFIYYESINQNILRSNISWHPQIGGLQNFGARCRKIPPGTPRHWGMCSRWRPRRGMGWKGCCGCGFQRRSEGMCNEIKYSPIRLIFVCSIGFRWVQNGYRFLTRNHFAPGAKKEWLITRLRRSSNRSKN